MKIVSFFEKFEGESLTYDDLILLPGYIDFPLDHVNLSTPLTRTIELSIPIISSPMDTVTEANLAIAIALQGGIGMIHYNLSPEKQLEEVRKVKRFKNGFVSDPITLPPTARIHDVLQIRREKGYSTIPITASGKLLGMVTKYDYSTSSEEGLNKTVAERMIPVESLTLAMRDDVFDFVKVNERLFNCHSPALPIVDEEGYLHGLITRSDLEKHQNYPHAALDHSGSLLVGAAVETWPEKAKRRIELIHDAVDLIVFDTAQGFTSYELELIRWTKKNFPSLQIIGGNVVTMDACMALIEAGADAIRVGMGIGSICTTQQVGGIGRGQATALYECASLCRKHSIPVIADGGITKSADIVKALSLGASHVMLGSLLAGTLESPGRHRTKDGICLKEYRGMGSHEAMEKGSSVRYGMETSNIRVPEGVSGLVPSRGAVSEWVPCLTQAVKQGFHKLGTQNIKELHEKIDRNEVCLERRSEGAKREGSVHNLYEITTTGPSKRESGENQWKE